MELDKFIESDGRFFNWSVIEKDCGIPNSSLRSYVCGRRKLSMENFYKLSKFFKRYGVELTYKNEDGRATSVENWDLASSYPVSRASSRYRVVGGKLQTPVLRDGKMMVRV